MIYKDDPQLITSDDALADLVAHLRDAGSFAYDTEFIGELSYAPRICLVQVATPQSLALIDPLVPVDLTPVWELIADPSIRKIVHAGAQDLEPAVRFIGKPPANVFDTQLAAGFIGLSYPASLAKLIRELLGVALGKGLTYTSWDDRPISAVHQAYAADDVRYLPALKDAIDQELDKRDHADWASQECASLENQMLYAPDPRETLGRIKGATALSAQKQQVMRELLMVRDEAARKRDQPLRTVIADQVLLRLARQPVQSLDALSNITNLARPVREEYGQAIVDATARALDEPTPPAPRRTRQDDSASYRFAVDAIWSMVAGYCHGRGIDPTLVTNRLEIAAWYDSVSGKAAPSNGRLHEGWRAQLLQEPLQAFMAGNLQLQFAWRDGALQAVTHEKP